MNHSLALCEADRIEFLSEPTVISMRRKATAFQKQETVTWFTPRMETALTNMVFFDPEKWWC